MPAITADRAEFLSGPNTVVVGTHDGKLHPTSTHGLCVLSSPDDGDRVRVWLPAAIAQRALADLAVEPRLAVTCSRASTHRTLQLKGRCVGIRAVGDDRFPEFNVRFASFVGECAVVGLPARLLERVAMWPLVELELAVADVFDQTPGPGAGARCADVT